MRTLPGKRRGRRRRCLKGKCSTMRRFKTGGAFFRIAIRGPARWLLPYRAGFRWCCAMPSQRNRWSGRRYRRLGRRGLGRHPTLHRPVSWHLEQHGEISAGIGGLWHISAPLESGLSEVNALKRAKVRRPERLFHRRVIRRGSLEGCYGTTNRRDKNQKLSLLRPKKRQSALYLRFVRTKTRRKEKILYREGIDVSSSFKGV